MKKRAARVKRASTQRAQLNWEVCYAAAQLERLAQTILGVPYTAAVLPRFKGLKLPEVWVNDEQRWAIARYLYELSQTPKAISAVIKGRPRVAKKRGAPPKSARNWKIRFDHKVTQERLGRGQAKRAVGEVMDAHKVTRSEVYATKSCEQATGWTEWEQYERGRIKLENPALSGDKLLQKISEEMRRPDNSPD